MHFGGERVFTICLKQLFLETPKCGGHKNWGNCTRMSPRGYGPATNYDISAVFFTGTKRARKRGDIDYELIAG